jgi:hypothetical protein
VHLLPGTAPYHGEFHRCGSCQQVYWKGPHYERMQRLLLQVMNDEWSLTAT